VKDPDQPEIDDPQRKEYDFLQAKAAQSQMSSGTFGGHHSAILPDVANPGESKKSRLEAMISEAVQSAVTQITTSVAAIEEVRLQPPANPQPAQMQVDVPREANKVEPQVMPAVGQQQVIQQQMQQPAQQPVFVHQQSTVEPRQYQTPQFQEIPGNQSQSHDTLPQPPSQDEVNAHAWVPPEPPRQSPLRFMDKMAAPDRPIQDIRASTLVERVDNREAPAEQPQDAPPPPRRTPPVFPENRAAFKPSEPFFDRGDTTADPQRSASQAKSTEQARESSEAMDSYSIEMAAFAEATVDSIRTLTRRLNDLTRALQGEGYDIR
jgi:hypothetical protein